MFPNFRFSSRSSPDSDLPFPVYRALIESLSKGAGADSANMLPYLLLGLYFILQAPRGHITVAAILVIVFSALRVFFERKQRLSCDGEGGRRLATVTDVERAELRYIRVLASFACGLGALVFLVMVEDREPYHQLLAVCAAIIFAVATPARCCGSPRAVAVQTVIAVSPFAAALILRGGFGEDLGAVLTLLLLRHLRDITRSLHGTLVSMLMARRAAEDVADKFDTALNNMTSGLVMIDNDRRVQVGNRKFADIFCLPGTPVDLALDELIALFIAPLVEGGGAVKEIGEFFAGRGGETAQWPMADGRILAFSRHPMALGSVVTVADVTAEHQAEQYINRMARYDAVTGLPNRVFFAESLEQAIADANAGERFGVLSIDLDRFKEVNDTFGHQIGDHLLTQVGERLNAAVGASGFVARFGGDEFLVLLREQKREIIAKIGDSIVQSVSAPYEIDDKILRVGASLGAAVFPDDAINGDAVSLLKAADLAVYDAKASGRGAMKFFVEDMALAIRRRRRLGEDLREAVARDEMTLVYQPIVDINQRRATAIEALLRWRHPEFGPISPCEFVPIAEENATIVDIGAFVLRRACSDALSWPGSVRVAVNLSALQFERGDLIGTVRAALAASSLPPDRLELEITESILICNHKSVLYTLKELHTLGVHVALDDFGTGYSSLSYLNDFAFDKVKVDRSFVRDIDPQENSKAASIIRAVNAIGRDLGMSVVVEGIETEEQLAALHTLGVRGAQGYFFMRPAPAEEIGVYLLKEMADIHRSTEPAALRVVG